MRYTEYHCGKAVIKDKALLSEAMQKLAMYEDQEANGGILNDWIPIEDLLPHPFEIVLVTCVNKKGQSDVNRAYRDTKGYWHGSGSMACVIAWMPRPRPYCGKQKAKG